MTARVIVTCKTERCGWVTPDPSGYCARCRADRPEPEDIPVRCCRFGCGDPAGSAWRETCYACQQSSWSRRACE